jgi:FkbM family methyltransferase
LKVGLKGAFGLAGLEVRQKRPGGLLSVERDSLRGVLLHARSVGCAPFTVIDVGAAYGSFTQECSAVFPDARYILIEPLVEYKPALERIVRSVEQAEYMEAAAAAHDDERTIHVHPDLVGSSLYREVEEGSNVNGTPRIIRTVTVDGVVRRNVANGPFFLKVDVQGAELDVLRGAEQTLRETEWVLLEVSFFRFFRDGPDICDVIAYMRSRGFAPYDIRELQYRPLDNALSQVDIVFVKENGLFRRRHHFATPEQREEENRKIQAHLRDRMRRMR